MQNNPWAAFAVKLLIGFGLTVVLLFSLFGFLATFEPNPPVTQWLWRVFYGAVAVACVSGLARTLCK